MIMIIQIDYNVKRLYDNMNTLDITLQYIINRN